MTDAIIKKGEEKRNRDVTNDELWLKNRIQRLEEKRLVLHERLRNVDKELEERKEQLQKLI